MDIKDLLSEVFTTLRISSEIYFRTTFSEDYAVQIPPEKRHIRFHIVLRGGCWLQVTDHQPVFMGEGDIALVPHGVSQAIKSSADQVPEDLSTVLSRVGLKNDTLKLGHGVETAALLCGFCQFDEAIDHPVMAMLPDLFHLRSQDLGALPWLNSAVRLMALEANLNSYGSTAIISRLIEVIFIQAVRQKAQDQEGNRQGFVGALSDPALARALSAMHSRPEEKWTVADLAVLAGMSRASFAKKFVQQIGKTPMEYLRDWRLMKARQLLISTALPIEEISLRCGYESLPSFSRLFKARFDTGPATFRKTMYAAQ